MCIYSFVCKIDTKFVCVSVCLVCNYTANNYAFAVFLSLCVHVPAYWQPGNNRGVLAVYLSKHRCLSSAETGHHLKRWCHAKSPLSVRTAGGCLTKAGYYSYFYCYIMWCGSAEALDVSFCPPSLCGKSLWKILWQREKCVVWLHGSNVHNNIRMLKKEKKNEYCCPKPVSVMVMWTVHMCFYLIEDN